MKALSKLYLFLFIFLVGCTPKMTVSPMERYHLADVVMKADRDPLTQKMNEHAFFSREGSEAEVGELAVVDAGVINHEKTSGYPVFYCLLKSRSQFAPKIIKISAVLLKPVPGFFKSIQAWIPVYAGIVATHALSGATTEVKCQN